MPAKIYIKEFDKWIDKKKELHKKHVIPPLFKECDIWWASIGINVGYEVISFSSMPKQRGHG